MAHTTIEEARAAKAQALEQFRWFGNVVGVGITRVDDDYGVKVNLRDPVAPEIAMPSHINGVPVRVEIIGGIAPRL